MHRKCKSFHPSFDGFTLFLNNTYEWSTTLERVHEIRGSPLVTMLGIKIFTWKLWWNPSSHKLTSHEHLKNYIGYTLVSKMSNNFSFILPWKFTPLFLFHPSSFILIVNPFVINIPIKTFVSSRLSNTIL